MFIYIKFYIYIFIYKKIELKIFTYMIVKSESNNQRNKNVIYECK